MLTPVCAALAAAHPPAPPPVPGIAPPVFSGAPAARIALRTAPLGVDPDGAWRWLVRVEMFDARGRPTVMVHGGDVDFTPSRGASAQWQTRSRFDAPAAIVRTTAAGPLSVRVRVVVPKGIAPATASIDTRRWSRKQIPTAVAGALGPHAVRIGWFPRRRDATVRVVRVAADGSRRIIGVVAPPSSGFRDLTVRPGARYHYVLRGVSAPPLEVRVPPEPPPVSLAAYRGKGVWLAFSPSTGDPDAYARLDPAGVVACAAEAGLRYIELRTAYGPYWEVTPQARAVVDALIDRASARGIAVIGWTVPRAASFEDLALSVRTAEYRTARGNRFAGLAVDEERGDEFMGDGAAGRAGLVDYARELRAALGPRYPIVATVEDPFLERLTNAQYPYREIAANVAALQPMAYWRMLSQRITTPPATSAAIRRSVAATLREAGRRLPINVGGQTASLSREGAPSGAEIDASLAAARGAGAIGEAFFDWAGTSAEAWEAIARFRW